MLEQKIIKALLDHTAYVNYRKKVTSISDGMKPWFDTLDQWHEGHSSSLSPEELYNLHISRHPSVTKAAKELIATTYKLIEEDDANPEVITTLIDTKYKQEKFASWGELLIKLSEGSDKILLADLEQEIKEFSEGVVSEHEFVPFAISAEQMLDASTAQGKWTFNLKVWQEKIGGVGPGVFGLFAARPNAGKTLAALSSCFGPDGWADQGAKIFWLGNEEAIHRTKHRAVCCWKGINYYDSTRSKRAEFITAVEEFDAKFNGSVIFYHKTGLDYTKIEDIIKEHSPDIVLIDQLDKLHVPGDQDGHVRLRKLYTTIREYAVNNMVAILGVSQASDEASGKKFFGFEALEGSKTGKGAELDLCICIGAENLQQDSGVRYFYIAKNKLTGVEETGSYMINKEQSRMTS